MLEVERLRFRYPGAESVAMQFDLSVADGEVLSLIGPSGSGKSTLLNLVAGFLPAQSGAIRVDGNDIVGLEVARRPLSMVFQQHNLFPHLDLFTNVALGVNPSLRLDAEQAQRVAEALARLGLQGLEKRLPAELSGGQRQRVSLARALVRKCRLLLLDEAFAALGPALRGELIELVRDLVAEENMAALLVSHQPADALLASARTAFIHQGRVLCIEATAQLLQQSQRPEIRAYLGAQ